MTYAEALKEGYINADCAYQRGYVSRRINPSKQPILTAGGNRKGDMFVLLPSAQSTQYCIRQYITKA